MENVDFQARRAMRHGLTLASATVVTIVLLSAIPPLGPSGAHAAGSPLAAFEYAPCVTCKLPGNLVFFNANFSLSPAGPIVSYSWNFGDGSPVSKTTSPTVSHVYLSGNAWTVTLTVQDFTGATDTINQVVMFYVLPGFTFQPPQTQVGLPVIFNASSSISYMPSLNPILGYNWNFGDGTTGSGKMTSHTYAIPGPYRVQLTLITVQGDPSMTKTLTVLPEIPQKIVQTIFQKINVTAFATFMINGTAKTLTGMASVTAVNTTSGATILFKNFSISVSFGNAIMTSFILAIPAEGQTLSIDCSLNVTTGVASCLVSRDLDLDHDGKVDVLDASMIGAAWQSTPAGQTWNPAADLNADGKVDILDVSLFGAFWQTRAFT